MSADQFELLFDALAGAYAPVVELWGVITLLAAAGIFALIAVALGIREVLNRI